MKLLVLGGTAWLGRTTAASAIAAGHDVTCAARGTDVPHGAQHVRVDRDIADGLASLIDTRWDAAIDISRQPGQVRRAARQLRTGAVCLRLDLQRVREPGRDRCGRVGATARTPRRRRDDRP